MSALVWDQVGEKFFETGVDRGVLYPVDPSTGKYQKGVAWNGLISVNESPSGAEATKLFADNIKYLSLVSAEDFGGTITAYYYPPEFEKCDGMDSIRKGITISQQPRRMFGLSYRTKIGNDVAGEEKGYKLHLVYGCLASPSEKSRSTINESPSAVEFSWTFTTTPVPITGFAPCAHLVIDSTQVSISDMKKIEDALYGTSGTGTTAEPKLLMPDDILTLLPTQTNFTT